MVSELLSETDLNYLNHWKTEYCLSRQLKKKLGNNKPIWTSLPAACRIFQTTFRHILRQRRRSLSVLCSPSLSDSDLRLCQRLCADVMASRLCLREVRYSGVSSGSRRTRASYCESLSGETLPRGWTCLALRQRLKGAAVACWLEACGPVLTCGELVVRNAPVDSIHPS